MKRIPSAWSIHEPNAHSLGTWLRTARQRMGCFVAFVQLLQRISNISIGTNLDPKAVDLRMATIIRLKLW
jgi:hypothetical protein